MHEVQDKRGQVYCFRKIEGNDAGKLGDFFTSLSTQTTSRFGPHPLTEQHARLLCQTIDTDTAVRYILIDKRFDKIAGYFILQYEVPRHDIDRYFEYGIQLVPGLDPLFAPSLGDEYQDRGLASAVMPLIIEEVEVKGARRIVLMGGTQATNAIAIAFYEKQGFKKYGEFKTEVNNYDMMLLIEDM